MTTKWWLLLSFVLFVWQGQAKRFNISRHYQGDIYTLTDGKCRSDFCHGNGNRAAPIPWATCQCQCLPASPVFREDIGKCVGTISECGEHMAVFVSPAFTESVPFVSLPEKYSLLYPTAEISLTDPSFAAVGPNMCVLTYLKVLGENGWEEVEQLSNEKSPTFKAVGESGKLFLQFTGDIDMRKRLSSGLVMVDVSCERETALTATTTTASVQSKYCIIFRVDNFSELENVVTRTNDYVIVGLCVGLLGVTYVGAVVIYLLVRRQKRHRAIRKSSEVPSCELGIDNPASDPQYEFVMDTNEELLNSKSDEATSKIVEKSAGNNDAMQSVRVECVPLSGLQLETKVSKTDFIQLKRRLLFDPSFLNPDVLDSPSPAAVEFLTRVREMITVAKNRIRNGRFMPTLGAIQEESRMLNNESHEIGGHINEAFGLQMSEVFDEEATEFGLVDDDDRFTFLARIPEDKMLTDNYDGLYDFDSFRQEMVKKMQKKRREQMTANEKTSSQDPEYDDWVNDQEENSNKQIDSIDPFKGQSGPTNGRFSRALILKQMENGDSLYDVPNSSDTRPISSYLFGDETTNGKPKHQLNSELKVNGVELNHTDDSGYHSGDSELPNKGLSKCASNLASVRTILSLNKIPESSSDNVQQVTIGQWLSVGEGDDQLVIDYDRINRSSSNFSETDFSAVAFMSTLESTMNLDDEIESSSSSDYSDSLEGTPVLR